MSGPTFTTNTESSCVLTTRSVAETIALGRKIGERLQPGDVVALVGRLGAGKTHLTKGISVGIGVADDRSVNSPTFVLVNEYTGRAPIRHIDAYRLSGPDELAALGFDEMLRDGSIVIVEWAERVADAIPPAALRIEIDTIDESGRTFTCTSADATVRERVITPVARP